MKESEDSRPRRTGRWQRRRERLKGRRTIRKRLVALVVLLALTLLFPVAGLVVRSATFRVWAARQLVDEVEARTGAQVSIGSLVATGWLPPEVTLSGVAIVKDGRTLLRAPRVVIVTRVSPLLRGDVAIASLRIERADLELDLDHPPVASGGTQARPTQIRIDGLEIVDARLHLVAVSRGLEIDLPALQATSPGFLSSGRVYVRVRAEGARVALAGHVLQPVDVTARLSRDERGMRLEDVEASAPGLKAWLSATLEPGDDAVTRPAALSWRAQGELEAGTSPLVALGLLPPQSPVGVVTWRGQVHGTGSTWQSSGAVASDSLIARQAFVPSLELRQLRANVQASPRSLELIDLRAHAAGGALEGSVRATHGTDAWRISGHASLSGASVAEIPLSARLHETASRLSSRATLELDGAASVPGTAPPVVKGAWTLELQPGPPSAGLPVGGDARGSLSAGSMDIAAAHLVAGDAELQAHGSVSLAGALDIGYDADVPDLASSLAALAPSIPAAARLADAGLGGAATIHGTLGGSVAAPALQADVTAADLTARGVALGDAEADLRWSEGHLTAVTAHVAGPALEARLDDAVLFGAPAGRWEILRADLAPLAEALGRPGLASGSLAGSGTIVAEDGQPALLGTFDAEPAVLAGLTLDRVEMRGLVSHGGVRVDGASATSGEGRASASGEMPWSGGAEHAGSHGLDLTVTAWPLEKDVAGASATASLALQATLGGTVAAPMLLDGTWRLDGLRWRKLGPFDLEGDARRDGEEVALTVRGPAGLEGDMRMGLGAGLPARGRLHVPSLGVPLPARHAERQLRATATDVTLEIEGPLRDLASVRVELVAEALEVTSEAWTATSAGPLRVHGMAGDLALDPLELRLGGLALHVEGPMALASPPTYDLHVTGSTDLRALEPMLDIGRLGGHAELDMHVAGKGADLDLRGGVTITQGYLHALRFFNSIQAVEARLEIADDNIRVVRFDGVLGGGHVEGSGTVALEGWSVGDWQMEAHGQAVGLRVPEDLRTVSDADVVALGHGRVGLVSGDVRVLRARFTREFNVALSGGARPLDLLAAPGRLDDLRLDLHLRADDQFVVDNELLSAELRADLDIVGTAARPVLVGEMDAVRAGTFRYRRIDYNLNDLALVYSRSFPNDPEIEAEAETRVASYDVTMNLSGRLTSPQVELSSSPELPQESLVALLLTGGTLGGDSGGSSSTTSSAVSLASQIDPLGGGGRGTGLDALRLDPVFVEGNALPVARLTLGRQIGPRVFAAYSASIRGDREGSAELRYQARPHLEVRLAREDQGTAIGEVRWTRSFETGGHSAMAAAASKAGPRVASLNLVGASAADREALLKELALEPGQPASRSDLLRAAARAHAVMTASDRPLARIDCALDPPAASAAGTPAGDAPPPDGPADVTCRVDSGPVVKLVVAGADPKDEPRVRRAVQEAWSELAFRDELVPAGAIAAQESYLRRGRAHVTVSGSSEDAEDGLLVTLTVEPGEVVRVGDVDIKGVASIPVEKLEREMASPHRAPFRHLRVTPSLLAGDRRALQATYQRKGWLDAKVAPPTVDYPEDAARARVSFTVEEGQRWQLAGVSYAGETLVTEESLRAEFPLHAGEVVLPGKIDEFARKIADDYDAKGHPDASVTWELQRQEAGAWIDVKIAEGPEVHVGDVRVEGTRRTRDKAVLRALKLQPGDAYSRADLATARRRLRDLGLFASVTVRGVPREKEPEVRDVLVRVREKDDLDVALGLGVDDGQPRASFSLGERNIAGVGGSVALQLRVAGGDRLVRLLGGIPRVAGTRNDLLLSIGAQQIVRPTFTLETRVLGVQLSRPLSATSTLLARYRVEDVRLPRVLTGLPLEEVRFSEGVIAGIGMDYLRDTRDDPLWASSGSLTSVDVGIHAPVFGSDFSFVNVFLQDTRSARVGSNGLVVSGSARVGAGWAFGGSTALPLSERYFAGGVSTIRGWKRDHVGPKLPGTTKPVGGEGLVLLNGEMRYPLTPKITALAFLDGASVSERASGVFSTHLQWSAGPGVALSTPVGPLRFYYGIKLDRPAGESAGEFHFTFGPTF